MEQLGWKLVMCGGVFSAVRKATPEPAEASDATEPAEDTSVAPHSRDRALAGAAS